MFDSKVNVGVCLFQDAVKMKAVVVLLCVVLATSDVVSADDCPEYCVCSSGPMSTARCTRLNEAMLFPERIKHLVLESVPGLEINLTKSFFRNVGLLQLQSLKIVNCSISYIDVGAFEELIELTEVNLSDNGLILIHPDTFQNNSQLRNLVLSGNPLQLTQLLKSEEEYFLKSSSLIELVLSRCQLSDIGKKLLAQVPNLQFINLNSNNIKVIDDYIFENVPLLDEVDLSNNMLMSLNDEIFEDIEELTTLNLRHNLIESIDDLDMPGLKELDVSNNKIKLLRKNTFEGIPDLSTLNISSNEISWVSEETFKDLIELRHLDLSNNNLMGPLPKFLLEENEFLETLKIGGNEEMHIFEGFSTELPKLYLLDISNCGISFLTNSSFNGMPSLAILNMSNNGLSTINHTLMSKLHRLNDLDVSHNELEKIGTYTFASNSHLKKLNLSHNKLSHLAPNTFETTPYLEHLDISYNHFSHLWHHNESQYMKDNKFLSELGYLNIAGNQIKELHKLNFGHLTNLKAVNVLQNPLECTSEFPGFIEWLYQNHVEPLNFVGKSAEVVKKIEKLDKLNLQWDDLLTDVCKLSTENIEIKKPLEDGNIETVKENNLDYYQYTVENIKLKQAKLEGEVEGMTDKDVLEEELNTYVWPTFLVVFSIVFLTLAIGNTVALLVYRHRNLQAPQFRSPFRSTIVKIDTTPRYHKLYEECSTPITHTPIVKSNLLGNLVSSQIKGAVLLKSSNDEV